MKNKIRTELNRELQTVSISRELKGRILMAAAEERFPEQNKRIRIAPLAAAAAVILICGLTLGVISLRTEKIDRRSTSLSSGSGEWVWVSDTDNLYHSQSPCGETAGMVRAALEQAKGQGRSACQECMTGVQLVTGAESEVMLVWANAGGRYYHSDEHCSGMRGATQWTIERAEDADKESCPVCIGGFEAQPVPSPTPEPIEVTPEPRMVGGQDLVWTTAGGRYYHCDEHCSGMEGAIQKTFAEVAASMNACPACYGLSMEAGSVTPEPTPMPTKESEIEAWATRGGKYYHCDEHCSGMQGAVLMMIDPAQSGKVKCLVCWPAMEAACTPAPEPMGEAVNPEEAMVWATAGGDYYHFDEYCSGMLDEYCSDMQSAEMWLLGDAHAAGKKPCPVCILPGGELWQESIAEGSIAVVVYEDEMVLTVEAVPEPKLEWIDCEASRPVDLDNAEVNRVLNDIAAECMTEEELSEMKGLLETGEIMGFRCIRYNFFFENEETDNSAEAMDVATGDRRVHLMTAKHRGELSDTVNIGVVATEIACVFYGDNDVQVLTNTIAMVEESRIQTDAGWLIEFSQERADTVFPTIIASLPISQRCEEANESAVG